MAAVTIAVKCPHCQSEDVIKNGKDPKGKQRFMCKNPDCKHKTFRLEYDYQACIPAVKQAIVDLALNGSGVRDTSRVLKVSPNTVTSTLKKNG